MGRGKGGGGSTNPAAASRGLEHPHCCVHVNCTGNPTSYFATFTKLLTINVPFVNRPFESEIHGTVNFTQFCCVLLVTWCYRVLLSCYLRPK